MFLYVFFPERNLNYAVTHRLLFSFYVENTLLEFFFPKKSKLWVQIRVRYKEGVVVAEKGCLALTR